MSDIREAQFELALLHPKWWASWLGVLLIAMLSYAPNSWRMALGGWLGEQYIKRNDKRRHIIDCNLKHVFPDLPEDKREQLVLETGQHVACAWLQYGVLFFRRAYALQQLIHLEQSADFKEALSQKQPILLLLLHTAHLDLAPPALGQILPCFGSYRPAKNKVLDWLMARNRLRSVEFVVPREAGMMRMIRSLKPGKAMILLADEDIGLKQSVFASFFNRSKATLTSPNRISKLTNAAAFAVAATLDKSTGRYTITIGDHIKTLGMEKDIEAARAMNIAFESLLESDPAQYLWQMKFFHHQPPGNPTIY